VIKLGGLGDVLLATPVLPNLRNYFPEAQIDFLTTLSNRDVLMDNIYINRILTFDVRIDKSFDLLRHIRNKRYNLVIDLYCNPRTALLTYITGAKYRVGFKFRGRSYAYNIIGRGRGGEVHNTDFNLDALRFANIPVTSKNVNITINVVHEEFADKFVEENNIHKDFLIGLAITGGWESKKYKIIDYVELIMLLLEKYNVKFVLLWGTKEELHDAEHIKKLFPEKSFIIPDTPIRYLAAIIERCNVIIGNDTGPLHLAAATNVPALGIFGPTNPYLQGPYGEQNVFVEHTELECLHCNLTQCPIGNICMTELPKDLIVKKFEELISKNKINIPEKIDN